VKLITAALLVLYATALIEPGELPAKPAIEARLMMRP
jgi:hypothetical protein